MTARAWSSSLVLVACLITASCLVTGDKMFFGKTNPPRENVMHYVSGSEPESLDPQIGTSQAEARIYMALYEGLVEYDPRTSEPIPALAERWEVNKDFSEITFHLRKTARFSNGDPITARDFVYTVRRGLAPKVASRNASLAYYIKYAQAYNEGDMFVWDPGRKAFLLERDFSADEKQAPALSTDNALFGKRATRPPSARSLQPNAPYPLNSGEKAGDTETAFHQFMHSPARLILPGDKEKRAKTLDANPKLKTAAAGDEFVPVEANDVGVEAVDDYTVRVSLVQSAPFFISVMPHQFFRIIHERTVETLGPAWTEPGNIVSSGPFKLEAWKPYDRMVVVRDPMYWDARSVRLDKIVFYMLQDNVTIMNLYKAGEIDAMYNHTVPAAWLDVIAPMKDFMDAPEAGIDYYLFNTTKGPTSDVRVRRALNMSLDKQALAQWRHVRPLTAMTPDGIFVGYPQPKGDPFDPGKARRLLAEAGYRDASDNFDAKKFADSDIELITNPDGNNIPYAEFIQAQWKQNLGVTIPIRIMESKTFFAAQSRLDYKGVSRTGWSADYMDPFTFLGLFYTPSGNNGTGWWDPKYVELLDAANREIDHHERYRLLAEAEKLLLEAQPVIPLTVGTTRWMKKPYVKGMYPNALTLHPWKWVYIERDEAKWDYGVPDMIH